MAYHYVVIRYNYLRDKLMFEDTLACCVCRRLRRPESQNSCTIRREQRASGVFSQLAQACRWSQWPGQCGSAGKTRRLYNDSACDRSFAFRHCNWRDWRVCGAGFVAPDRSVYQPLLFPALGDHSGLASGKSSGYFCDSGAGGGRVNRWPDGALWLGTYPRTWYPRGY